MEVKYATIKNTGEVIIYWNGLYVLAGLLIVLGITLIGLGVWFILLRTRGV